MIKSARRGLADAQNPTIETDSQFDLAYEAAHKFALAALRREGYRSENRITVFQTLVHTLATDKADLQILLKAHNERRWRSGSGWNSVGVVSVLKLESSGVGAPERRPRHDQGYHSY
jgi:hypothetical protein